MSESPKPRWFRRVALAIGLVATGAALPVLGAYAHVGAHMEMMGGHRMAMAHVQKMLSDVGASDDQKSKIEAILKSGLEPVEKLHGNMGATHKSLHDLLTAPVIDRDALERLRASEIASLDTVSRSAIKAMADAADVLQPAQRAKLKAEMEEHHGSN